METLSDGPTSGSFLPTGEGRYAALSKANSQEFVSKTGGFTEV
ncbi:MAG: hypothetical protein OXE99_07090 [Cellvibrionales bacterium]|nr:hypothetical protein [Cellvibrionales bacterium]